MSRTREQQYDLAHEIKKHQDEQACAESKRKYDDNQAFKAWQKDRQNEGDAIESDGEIEYSAAEYPEEVETESSVEMPVLVDVDPIVEPEESFKSKRNRFRNIQKQYQAALDHHEKALEELVSRTEEANEFGIYLTGNRIADIEGPGEDLALAHFHYEKATKELEQAEKLYKNMHQEFIVDTIENPAYIEYEAEQYRKQQRVLHEAQYNHYYRLFQHQTIDPVKYIETTKKPTL